VLGGAEHWGVIRKAAVQALHGKEQASWSKISPGRQNLDLDLLEEGVSTKEVLGRFYETNYADTPVNTSHTTDQNGGVGNDRSEIRLEIDRREATQLCLAHLGNSV
jgi:hypothetical protein